MDVLSVLLARQTRHQPFKVVNPPCCKLNRENIFPCPRLRLRIWSPVTGTATRLASALSFTTRRLNLVCSYRREANYYRREKVHCVQPTRESVALAQSHIHVRTVCMYVWSNTESSLDINRYGFIFIMYACIDSKHKKHFGHQPVWLSNLLVVSLTSEINFSLSPFAPENLISQERFGRRCGLFPSVLAVYSYYRSPLQDTYIDGYF